MDNSQRLAPHESMDLHELINLKTISLAKSKLMQGLVFDRELKALFQRDVDQSIPALAGLQRLYERADFSKERGAP